MEARQPCIAPKTSLGQTWVAPEGPPGLSKSPQEPADTSQTIHFCFGDPNNSGVITENARSNWTAINNHHIGWFLTAPGGS